MPDAGAIIVSPQTDGGESLFGPEFGVGTFVQNVSGTKIIAHISEGQFFASENVRRIQASPFFSRVRFDPARLSITAVVHARPDPDSPPVVLTSACTIGAANSSGNYPLSATFTIPHVGTHPLFIHSTYEPDADQDDLPHLFDHFRSGVTSALIVRCNPPPTISVVNEVFANNAETTVGVPVGGPIGVVSLSDATDRLFPGVPLVRVTVDWGDGTPAQQCTLQPIPERSFGGHIQYRVVAPSHTYDEPDEYPVTITVTPLSRRLGTPVSDVGTITVGSGVSVSGVVYNPPDYQYSDPNFAGNVGSLSVAPYNADVSGAVVAIDWGDGSDTSSGSLSPLEAGDEENDAVYNVVGSHTFPVLENPETYSGSVSVTIDEQNDSGNFDIEVA